MKTQPHLKFETIEWNRNYMAAGIDEVGRGAFAGPLVSAGVILKPITDSSTLKYLSSFQINDSKKVTKRNREMIAKNIGEFILFETIQFVDVSVINSVGIGEANKLAFSKVAQETQTFINTLKNKNLTFLTDAFRIPDIASDRQKNIIRGDATSISIALASILAKVKRDTYMEELGIEFPEYEFQKHKGYGTKLHREFLKLHGPCKHHRTEFIKNYI